MLLSPSPFGIRVSHQTQRYFLQSLPAAPGIRPSASWRSWILQQRPAGALVLVGDGLVRASAGGLPDLTTHRVQGVTGEFDQHGRGRNRSPPAGHGPAPSWRTPVPGPIDTASIRSAAVTGNSSKNRPNAAASLPGGAPHGSSRCRDRRQGVKYLWCRRQEISSTPMSTSPASLVGSSFSAATRAHTSRPRCARRPGRKWPPWTSTARRSRRAGRRV